MLETTIDSEIFIDFCKSQPDPIRSTKEFDKWFSFWLFLVAGTNLKFVLNENVNGQKIESRFFTELSSGQGDRGFKVLNKFNWPNRNILPQKTFPGSFFCLTQEDQNKREQLVNKNGMLIGFIDDYKKKWNDLSFQGKSKILSVRKGVKDAPHLEKWKDLTDYMLPFTDIIIYDNFILNDPSIRDSNFLELLKVLDSTVSSEYNLLIVTYEGTNNAPANIDEIYTYINSVIEKFKFKAKVGIVLASHSIKEHDRCIIMNYLRIKSGNTLNYFNRLGEIVINGTEIDFWPFCNQDNFLTTKVILSSINEIVKKELFRHVEIHIRGNIKNRLFEYCDD